jgi:hypothetical protein
MVWGWRDTAEHYGVFICFGLGLGTITSIPVMTIGLVVSERHASQTLAFGALTVGIITWLLIWNICWSIVHIT